MTDAAPNQARISDQEAKAFVLSCVALSVAAFNIAFWYGVFGTVFFEHLFYIWVVATVALAASLLVPPVRALPKFVSWHGRFVLILPTLWLLLEAALNATGSSSDIQQWMLWGLAIAVVLLTLPYLVYVLVMIAVPDIDQLRSPTLRAALFGFALTIAIAGFAIGKNHPLFLTCRDFKVAGSDVPENCRKSASYLAPSD